MRRGTTPTFKFKLPILVSSLKTAKVSIRQGETIVYKHLEDLQVMEDGYTLKLRLTQEETFMFDSDSYVSIQLRVLLEGDYAPDTPIFRVSLDECLDDEVLV